MKELSTKPQIRTWLAVVGASTLVLGATYAIAQQSTRLDANDSPLVAAQTAKHELENGAIPSDVIPSLKTDLTNDSTVFVTITDSSHHILASNAQLNGKPALPPSGVFDYTKSHGSDQITWQPASNARLAAEVLSYGQSPNDGFIITGQSLKPAEKRINTYTALAAAAWVAMLGWTSLVLLIPTSKK
jgi:hypothetical protein